MDSCVLPENFSSVLSSFVREQHNEDPKESGEKSAAGSKCCRGYEGFLRRVRSFNSLTWFAKPGWLSPPVCARYGWENVGPDTLQCVACRMHICGRLPPVYEPAVYAECCKRVEESLKNGHSICCSWANNPSPVSFLTVSLGTEQEESEKFLQRVSAFLPLGDKLPTITDSLLEQLQLDAGSSERLLSLVRSRLSLETPTPNDNAVLTSACVLALCGWKKRSDSTLSEETTCDLCFRNLGLWNFFSPANPNLSEESEEDKDQEIQGMPLNPEPEMDSSEKSSNAESNMEPTESSNPDTRTDQTQEEDRGGQNEMDVANAQENVDENRQDPGITETLAEQIVDIIDKAGSEEDKSESPALLTDYAIREEEETTEGENRKEEEEKSDCPMDTETQDSLPASNGEDLESDAIQNSSHVKENTEEGEEKEMEQEGVQESVQEQDNSESNQSDGLEGEDERPEDENKHTEGNEDESRQENNSSNSSENLKTDDPEQELNLKQDLSSSNDKDFGLDEDSIQEKQTLDTLDASVPDESDSKASESVQNGKEGIIEGKGLESIIATLKKSVQESKTTQEQAPKFEVSDSESEDELETNKSENSNSESSSMSRGHKESPSPKNRAESEQIAKGIIDDILKFIIPDIDSVADEGGEEVMDSNRSVEGESAATNESERGESAEKNESEKGESAEKNESEKGEPAEKSTPQDSEGNYMSGEMHGGSGEPGNESRKRGLDESKEEEEGTDADVAAQNKRNIELTEEDEEPRRKKFKKLQRTTFDPLNEHRPWCPWVTAAQPISIMDTTDVSHSSTHPSWRRLLYLLVPETSPIRINLRGRMKTHSESRMNMKIDFHSVETCTLTQRYPLPIHMIQGLPSPAHESLRNIRRILNDWTSPQCSPSNGSS